MQGRKKRTNSLNSGQISNQMYFLIKAYPVMVINIIYHQLSCTYKWLVII